MTPPPEPIPIRPARVADVSDMARIINEAAEFGLMLPRSLSMLYENVREHQVAESDGRIVGVCGLSIVWANLAEIAALAVDTAHRGQGLGKRLVMACLDEAAALGVRRVMTLTYEQTFFEKLGFSVVDRQQLPLKVWSECIRCPKNQACDEIAMIRVLDQVPELNAPAPQTPAAHEYTVPVTLRTPKSS